MKIFLNARTRRSSGTSQLEPSHQIQGQCDWLERLGHVRPDASGPRPPGCGVVVSAARGLGAEDLWNLRLQPAAEAAAAAMEPGASPEPDSAEVLPQHKFDSGSLEAYPNQHLPGFGAEPEAKLTVTQYRYRRRSSAETNVCIGLFFIWPCVGSQSPSSRLLFLQ